MRTIFKLRFLGVLSFFLFTPFLIQAQTPNPQDKKEAELKRLEAGVNTAKVKVAVNERKMTVADSLITAGNKLIAESKTETKAATADSKKLDKDYATEQKPLNKLVTSKDKEEATQARSDLKALTTKYKADSKAATTRLNSATKKGTTGEADINKGKAAKAATKDALKASKDALAAAQKKYDDVANPPEKAASGKKKK